MKSLYIPLALLTALLALSFWAGDFVEDSAARCLAGIEEVNTLFEAERWEEAVDRLEAVRRQWDLHQGLFHTLLDHQDLEEGEKLFAGAIAACREQDSVEFRILLGQLASQIRYLADTQALTLSNIL